MKGPFLPLAMIAAAIVVAICIIATSVGAQPHMMKNISGSKVSIEETEQPNAVAQIRFYNYSYNSSRDNQSFVLTLDDLNVSVTYTWISHEDGEDRITVEAPEGFVAIPSVLHVAEHGTDFVYIYPLDAVGV